VEEDGDIQYDDGIIIEADYNDPQKTASLRNYSKEFLKFAG
jgi:hypothetical protein